MDSADETVENVQDVDVDSKRTCVLEAHLSQYDWTCSRDYTSLKELNESKAGIEQNRRIRQQFPEFNMPSEGFICSECENTFGLRPGLSCKHPQHPSKYTKSLKTGKEHRITVKEYFTKYRSLNLLPNNVICKAHCQKMQLISESSDSSGDCNSPPAKIQVLSDFNKALDLLGIDTIDFKKRNKAGQMHLIEQKLYELNTAVKESFASTHELKFGEELKLSTLQQNSEDLANLMEKLRERIKHCSTQEQKSLLTLVPESWSIAKAMSYFNVGERVFTLSRHHVNEFGTILPPIQVREGPQIEISTKSQVINFYQREDVSRPCPGSNDKVSVKHEDTGKRELRPKKFLLANIKELYQIFKTENPNLKIGQSTFFSLRPKECLSYATKAFHNVCLCVYHQNCKLLFNAIRQPSMKPYMNMLVCVESTKDCFYRRCPDCNENEKEVLVRVTDETERLGKSVISYRRWLATDGTRFVTEEKAVEEFPAFVTQELQQTLRHHYISVKQNEHFKNTKANLKVSEIIIWGDFAENYAPVIQDSIQSEYFSNKAVTVHPFQVYYRSEESNQVEGTAYCVISDCTMHDTNSFYAFQAALIKDLKIKFSQPALMQLIHYFSDGCAAQYKNRKNFVNLFYHEEDFKIKADWNFFATAHGKGPCDAHGGTTKRLAKMESLRADSIQTALQLFEFGSKSIHNIKYLLVTKEQIDEIVQEKDLDSRYAQLGTVHGTQQAHQVIVQEEKLILYETSGDIEPLTTKTIVGTSKLPAVNISPASLGDWIACVYERQWCIGLITDVNMEEEEVEVAFWKSNSKNKPSTSFIKENASCWVPFGQILKELVLPKSSTLRRTMKVDFTLQEELKNILELYLK